MGQDNINAILGWWLLEGQGNKEWLLEASEKYLVLNAAELFYQLKG